MRKQKQIIVIPTKQDKTAWQLYKEQHPEEKGQRYLYVVPKQPINYAGMVFTVMAGILLLVALGSKFDKLMHDPFWGMIGTGAIILGAVFLFREFDRKFS